MNATDKRIQEVEEAAARAFAKHVITPEYEHGVYRRYSCGTPDGSCIYRFFITTFPGSLVVTGDIGDLLVQRVHDMFRWAPTAAESIDYFAAKVVRSMPTTEYDGEVLRESVAEYHQTLKEDAGDDDPRLATVADLLTHTDFSDQTLAMQDAYDAGLWDDGDGPAHKNYTRNFLWCREAVRWFFRHYQQRYLIVAVDRTRTSDLLVFWKPEGAGYTTAADLAGRYTLEDALAICRPRVDGVVEQLVLPASSLETHAVMDRDTSDVWTHFLTHNSQLHLNAKERTEDDSQQTA